tara:strand:+ start:1439 stop:2326 length:888 start_codon:yes stop_codon:yes gene_type:complete
MKKTQIVTHLMPPELEDYGDMLNQLSKSSNYLDDEDWVSIKVALNLSPTLINWNESKYKKDFFINYFNKLKNLTTWANEIIFDIVEDNSILGAADLKREAIKGKYDQFIFLDGDMIFHPMTLKCMLDISKQVDGYYFITPQIVRLWDTSWDILVHKDFKHIECKKNGYYREHHPNITLSQTPEDIEVTISPYFKFGCGWFTLCSKEILDLVGIPESFRGYGPDDTFLMYGSQIAKEAGYNINQYILEGIYVSENKIYRKDNFTDKIIYNDLKNDFREEIWKNMGPELDKIKKLVS